jgi:hypothetical protein
MNKQLKYFQEDVAFKLDCIMVILVYGLDFSMWVRAAIVGVCIGQFFYVLRAAWVFGREDAIKVMPAKTDTTDTTDGTEEESK